jgi:hypothetical protein
MVQRVAKLPWMSRTVGWAGTTTKSDFDRTVVTSTPSRPGTQVDRDEGEAIARRPPRSSAGYEAETCG